MCIAKTKALISFAVAAKHFYTFVFAYANCWFSDVSALLFGATGQLGHLMIERIKVEICYILLSIDQPHDNTPHFRAVFNITQPCRGSQNDYFAVCLL